MDANKSKQTVCMQSKQNERRLDGKWYFHKHFVYMDGHKGMNTEGGETERETEVEHGNDICWVVYIQPEGLRVGEAERSRQQDMTLGSETHRN